MVEVSGPGDRKSRLFWTTFATSTVGLGFAAYTGTSLFLVFLTVVFLCSVWWALHIRRLVVLLVGGIVLAATRLLLGIVTVQFGLFTEPLLIPAYWLSLIAWPIVFVGVLRLVFGKKVVVVLTSLLVLIIFGFAVRTIWFPLSGYVTQYLLWPTARLSVAGKRSNGYVHTLSWGVHRTVVVTRRRFGHGETYWVWFSLDKRRAPGAIRCDEWTAPQFPVFITTDVYEPCFHFSEQPRPEPDRKLLVGTNFAEFDADDGKRVKVEW